MSKNNTGEEVIESTTVRRIKPAGDVAMEGSDEITTLLADLGTPDIAAVASVIYEDKLEAARDRLTAQNTKLQKEIGDAETFVVDNCKAFVKTFKDAVVEAAAKALKAAGFGNYVAVYEIGEIDEKEQKFAIRLVVRTKNDDDDGGYYSRSSGHSREIEQVFTAAAKAKLVALRELRTAREKCIRDLAEVHRSLSNMGKVERRVRAGLAAHTLEGTEKGKKILAMINQVGLKALPAAVTKASKD